MAETTAPATYQPVNDEDYINKMYDSSLASQKQTLQQGYDQNVSNLDAEKQANQRQTDANLNRTYVESQKAQQGYNEVMNAYGLNTGAQAQARLARDNQLQSDLTTLRTAQQTADAEIERQRSLLAKEYASAIAKAQADNDFERAQALYEAAKSDEDRLLQLQKEAGNLLAEKNDYSILGQLYGLTQDQIDKLQGTGAYAPVYEEPAKTYRASGSEGSSGGSGDSDFTGKDTGYTAALKSAVAQAANNKTGTEIAASIRDDALSGNITPNQAQKILSRMYS